MSQYAGQCFYNPFSSAKRVCPFAVVERLHKLGVEIGEELPTFCCIKY